MLAFASRLFLFELEPNAYGARHSGFSVLAANLKNAPAVLAGLISDDRPLLTALGLDHQA
jgi:hypothetical protein